MPTDDKKSATALAMEAAKKAKASPAKKAKTPSAKQPNKSATKKTSRAQTRKAEKPKGETKTEDIQEAQVNLGIRVPKSQRTWWAGQAKLNGTTMTAVIKDALTDAFGLPPNQN